MRRRERIAWALAAGVIAVVYILVFDFVTRQFGPGASDFDQLWFAARALWHGSDPYTLIGPSRPFDWPWPLVYPLSTVVAALPFALLPLLLARVLFASLSAAIVTYALSIRGRGVLIVLLSASMADAVRMAQFSPLLTAAVLIPGFAVICPLKPHTGMTLALATGRVRTIVTATVSGFVLVGIAFAMQPGWFSAWLGAIRSAVHMRAPVFAFGGPLLLLALFRWRRLDARVLLACACVPHTPTLHDTLPLALVVRTYREGLVFGLLSYAALFAQDRFVTHAQNGAGSAIAANILNVAIYFPVLAVVLTRPNESHVNTLARSR